MLAFLRSADHLTADGWPVVLLARQVGKRVRRVTGSDLVESITRGAHGPLRIALLGAQEDVGDRWAGALARAGSSLVLREHGATADWDLRSLAARLNALAPDLVLVAVTPPRGEFVSAGLQAAGLLSPVVAVGGAIDMVTGTRRRAPGWAQRAGLEWLVRLVQEPRRLFVRYVLQSGPAGALVWLAAVAGPLEPQPSGGPSRVARTDRDRVG
jgi:N-acetylglucosaminyldiphosphoundecaprenol N-acetyl-beta-D-mannosaminyltransferase